MRILLVSSAVAHGPNPEDRFEIGAELTERDLPLDQLKALVDSKVAEPLADDFEAAIDGFTASSSETLRRLVLVVDHAEAAGADAVLRLHELLSGQMNERQEIGDRLQRLFATAASILDAPQASDLDSGIEKQPSRDAHNVEIAGASPAPASTITEPLEGAGEEAEVIPPSASDPAALTPHNPAEPGAGDADADDDKSEAEEPPAPNATRRRRTPAAAEGQPSTTEEPT